MAVFVIFVCGFSKWILNRRKAKCETEPGRAGAMAMAVEAAKTEGGK
jgi:hypothetical protein